MILFFFIIKSFSLTIFNPVNGYCNPVSKSVACDDKCIIDENKIECIEATILYFCRDPRLYFFIIWGAFLAGPVISLLFCIICCKKNMPPPCSFIINFVYGTLLSSIITGIYCAVADFNFNPVSIIMIALPAMFMLQGFCVFILGGLACCIKVKLRPHYIRNLMKSPVFTRDDLEKYIVQIRTNPPVIQMSGELQTQGMVQFMHKGMLRTRQSVQITPFQDIHPYVSWEERCDAIQIPTKKDIIILLMDIKFSFTEEMKMYMKYKAEQMVREASAGGGIATVKPVDYVQGLVESMLVSPKGHKPTIQKFTSSCFGRFLWVFLALIAQHSVYESIYCAHMGKFKLKSRKFISAQPDYHCPAYQPDPDAPTFT